MKKYKVIKDYRPLVNQIDGSQKQTDYTVLEKGDILTQQDENANRFQSRKQKHFSIYEYTIKKYPDVFKEY